MPIKYFDRAVENYQAKFQLLDQLLYDLCQKHPDHTDRHSVYAKLWVIGRAYTTGIERAIRANGKMGGSLTALAEQMVSKGKQLNELFSELAEVSQPLTEENAKQVIALHGRFIKIIGSVLRAKISPRSFASKYMHFHCNAVPIIDSVADAKLRTLVRWRTAFNFGMPKNADDYYGWFVMRFLALYRQVQNEGHHPTVKLIDAFLLEG
jgi:hypothetical protein